MNLIDTIEIFYFRSIYRYTIKDLKELNVFSGKNDVGKSNILRALNLFFNNHTETGVLNDFYRDFSKERLKDVRDESIKGKQFIAIAITFNRPDSYSGSLPKKFRVKRTWTRDTDFPNQIDNLETFEKKGELPSSLETSRRFLSKFLNKIHYEYIPAVKDKSYHQNLLQRLQSSVLKVSTSSDADINNVSDDLAEHIEDKIHELKNDFENATNLESNINPPEQLSSLFQSFYVSTRSDGLDIPLFNRGDGIQVRYIPSVLNYIVNNNSDYFIWGFEEPENSLEYGYTKQLAHDFVTNYSKKAQIFITSHSPAFISIKSDRNTCFRVFKSENKTEIFSVYPEKTKSERDLLNKELGLHKIFEELDNEISEKLKDFESLKSNFNELERQIKENDKPIILTEGKTDCTILIEAWNKIRDEEIPYKILPADPMYGTDNGSAAGAPTLKKMIESFHPELDRTVIAVFDRDEEGIKQFNSLDNNFKVLNENKDIKVHGNERSYALILPEVDSRTDYVNCENLCIEYFFSDDCLSKKTNEGYGLVFEEQEISLKVGHSGFIQTEIPLEDEFYEKNIIPRRKIKSGKKVFAESIVPTFESDEFSDFEMIFDMLEDIMS